MKYSGRGYGEADVIWLWRKLLAHFTANKRNPTQYEWDKLFSELDKLRKHVPDWRLDAASQTAKRSGTD